MVAEKRGKFGPGADPRILPTKKGSNKLDWHLGQFFMALPWPCKGGAIHTYPREPTVRRQNPRGIYKMKHSIVVSGNKPRSVELKVLVARTGSAVILRQRERDSRDMAPEQVSLILLHKFWIMGCFSFSNCIKRANSSQYKSLNWKAKEFGKQENATTERVVLSFSFTFFQEKKALKKLFSRKTSMAYFKSILLHFSCTLKTILSQKKSFF